MAKEDYFEQLDQYLDGKLSNAEQETIRKRLQKDTTFALQLAALKTLRLGVRRFGRKQTQQKIQTFLLDSGDYREASRVIHQAGRKELFGKMQQWEEEGVRSIQTSTVSKPSSGIIGLRWWAVAASVSILLLAGWYLWRPSEQDRLVTAYFKPFPALGVQRNSSVGDAETQYKLALQYYANEDWQEAIRQLEKVEVREFPMADFYRGVALLANKEYDIASGVFESFSESAIKLNLVERNLWYKALAAIGKGDTEEARQSLQKLKTNTQHNFPVDQILLELE